MEESKPQRPGLEIKTRYRYAGNPPKRRTKTQERFGRVLEHIKAGDSRKEAVAKEGWKWESFKRMLRPRSTEGDLHLWREEQLRMAEAVRDQSIDSDTSLARRMVESMSLEDFRSQVLGRETFAHQRQWVEWGFDPSCRRVLIVTCPDSAKTQTWKDILLYEIAKNPNMRAAYMTFSHDRAVEHVDSIRRVIVENERLKVVAGDLKPPEEKGYVWSASRFMVRGRSFDAGKDQTNATLTAFGHSSQMAGARLDFLLVDDVDAKDDISPSDRQKIFDRLMVIGRSRLGVAGRMVVICNRWDENDVAGLIKQRAMAKPGLWKVYESPAVIRPRDKTVKGDYGEVIWPERFGTTTGEVGDPWTRKRAWDYFQEVKFELGSRQFALMYQCDPSQDASRTFTAEVIQRAKDRGKGFSIGTVPPASTVVCALDPAGEGGACAVICLAVQADGSIVVVDSEWVPRNDHAGLIDWIHTFNRYGPIYWGIEAQGGFSLFTKDKEVRRAVSRVGASLIELKTNQNKHALDVGVTSLVPDVEENMILPADDPEMRLVPLLQQLSDYRAPYWNGVRWVKPSGAQDAVMTLWLAMRVIRDRGLRGAPSGQNINRWGTGRHSLSSKGMWKLEPGRRVSY